MEKHYTFKSFFKENIIQVSSIAAERWGLRWNACASRHIFYGVRTVRGWPAGFLLTIDAVVLNCVTQFNIVWRVGTFPFLPMPKCSRKTRCIIVAESLFVKNISTPNARWSSDDNCMLIKGFKPLYPAMYVSLRPLQICRHGAKFKSSNYFCPILYKNGSLWEWECSRRRVLLAEWGEDYSSMARLSTTVLLEWVTPPVGYEQSVVRTGYSFAVATPQIRHWPCADNRALI
jgi:hypothetical protein